MDIVQSLQPKNHFVIIRSLTTSLMQTLITMCPFVLSGHWLSNIESTWALAHSIMITMDNGTMLMICAHILYPYARLCVLFRAFDTQTVHNYHTITSNGIRLGSWKIITKQMKIYI